MEMQKNVCNIIWVDDDIDTLYNDSCKRALRRAGLKLIGKAHTFAEFTRIMDICYDRVDAVITDANFSADMQSPKTERDLSGFVKIRECIKAYNQKRTIPFYLYTGRSNVLNDKYDDGELDYFDLNKRFFLKGDFEQMFEQIKEEVGDINSPSYRIRTKYYAELNAASILDGNEKALFEALLYKYSDEWKNTEDYFTPMRKIVERIFSECKTLQIIPNDLSLNSFHYYMMDKEKTYKLKDEYKDLMPKPLAHSLRFFLNITQDGSHDTSGLTLGVNKYVRETKNINLFRSVLYIAMDMCLWFYDIRISNDDFSVAKWEERDNDNFEHKGVVRKLDNGGYVCDNYLLQYPKNEEYKEGDKIGIIKSTENKPDKVFTYLCKNEEIRVDRFVLTRSLKIQN